MRIDFKEFSKVLRDNFSYILETTNKKFLTKLDFNDYKTSIDKEIVKIDNIENNKADKKYVDDSVTNINIPDISNLATTEYVDNAIVPKMKIKNVIFELTQEQLIEMFNGTTYSRISLPYTTKVKNVSCCIIDYMGTYYKCLYDSRIKNIKLSVSDNFYIDICLENNENYDDSENELCLELEIYNNTFTGNIRLLELESDSDIYFNNIDVEILSSLSIGRKEGSVVGSQSFSCGRDNIASGAHSMALGRENEALGEGSVARGRSSISQGTYSYAGGFSAKALGNSSHAEGTSTIAKGNISHAEGYSTIANYCQHVEGKYNVEDTENKYAHIVGNGTSNTARSNAHTLDWEGNGWYSGCVSQDGIPTEDKDLVTKQYVDSKTPFFKIEDIVFELTREQIQEAYDNRDVNDSSLYFETDNSYIIDEDADYVLEYNGYYIDCDYVDFEEIDFHDIDDEENQIGGGLFYKGFNKNWDKDETKAIIQINRFSKESPSTIVSGMRLLKTSSYKLNKFDLGKDIDFRNSISVGRKRNSRIGDYSSALGRDTVASGLNSHAEGYYTTASGNASHAEGYNTTASGSVSHSEGLHTIASGETQHVQGKYNIEDTKNKYAHIVGNGTSKARSNAYTLDWQGNGWYQGKLSQDGTPTEDKDLVTKAYVDNSVANVDFPKVVDLGENPKLNENDYSLIENWTYGTGFFKVTWTGKIDICLNNQGEIIYKGFWLTTPLYIFVERYVNTSDTKQIRFKDLISDEYFDAYYDIVDNVVTQYSYYQERCFNRAEYYSKRDIDNKNYATEEYVDDSISAIPQPDLSNYSTTDHTHSQYLTEHQSLSNYYTKEEIDNTIDNIPTYTAGTGISIANGVISINLPRAESEVF